MYASTAVIEGGKAMMVLGGIHAFQPLHPLSSTQIVRPGQPTVQGPSLTEAGFLQCAATIGDGLVMLTGGRTQTDQGGSARVEVYNFTSMQWTQVGSMRQRRYWHSCTQVWLTPDDPDILTTVTTNTSVLGVVVAGGWYTCIMHHIYI